MIKRNDESTRIRGHKWVRWRREILRVRPLCVECEREGRAEAATEIDHVVALCNGGSNEAENLQPLCSEHHRRKTASDLGYVYRPRIGPDGWPVEG